MAQTAAVNLLLRVGDTFGKVFRYGAGPIVYRPITAISNAAPAVLSVPGHGLPDGWPVAVTNVKGMTQINASAIPPVAADYVRATLIDADTISLNAVNAGGFSAYKSGGTIQYATPVDLTGMTGEFLVYPNADKTAVPISFVNNVALDNVLKTITLSLSATEVMMLAGAMKKGSFDFNLKSGLTTISLAGGNITFDPGTGTPLQA